MLGGGVIVQRFGDLMRGRRSTVKRGSKNAFVTPTLNATPGDLSLVLPKRILDGIIEMIYALDTHRARHGQRRYAALRRRGQVLQHGGRAERASGNARYKGLYIIGDGSGITHSLSHASASGVFVAREILNEL